MNEIEENNKIIDRFLGKLYEGLCEYHRDWNLLMPVVEKIESLKAKSGKTYVVSIEGMACHIIDPQYFSKGTDYYNATNIAGAGVDDKRAVVWLAVIEFIKFYNKNKQIPG